MHSAIADHLLINAQPVSKQPLPANPPVLLFRVV